MILPVGYLGLVDVPLRKATAPSGSSLGTPPFSNLFGPKWGEDEGIYSFTILCYDKFNEGTEWIRRKCYSGEVGLMASPSTQRNGCVVGMDHP